MLSIRSLAALAAAVSVATPVIAKQSSPVTVVASQPSSVTLATWSTSVEQALNRHLHYPAAMGGQLPASGTVRVKFNCSDSGRPDKVTVYKSSGDAGLDYAALRAVRRIATLHPLPDGMIHGQKFVATIMFATSPENYEEQVRAMRAAAAKSNEWFKGPTRIALLDDATGAAN